MRLYHDHKVIARLSADPRAMQLIHERHIAIAALAAGARRAFPVGRRWFAICC